MEGTPPPPPSPWLLPARSAAAEGEGRGRPRALPPAGPASVARAPSGPAFPGAGTRSARASGRRQGRQLRGSGLAPHNQPAPPPARLSASRHRRSSVHSAIPWPACPGSRPALPWTRPSSSGFRRAWSRRSEAVPIDGLQKRTEGGGEAEMANITVRQHSQAMTFRGKESSERIHIGTN
ncbi:uncharacterized protein LOC115029413 [Mus caroli]|uniref:Uncharacterized protein LOC115029413 n=1 Tax=Mus caroli TaxID=10089 RepID=A0A6P7QH80_MUSCR|nr:uncharacterized protein LOC115029413 [Mus caroli]